MTTPKVFIVNAQTGEESLRDFNAAELVQHEKDVSEAAATKAAELATSNAKKEAADKLLALGIDPTLLGLSVPTE
jgi:hypothetical protein